MTKVLVIPDLQVKPGVPLKHLDWIGKFIVDKKPDYIVQIGDFADMPSLSSYDVGKKSFEGRRYRDDVKSVFDAQVILFNELNTLQRKQRKNKEKIYNPCKILTLGNHEDRILRAINNDPKLDGTISLDDLRFNDFGWKVVPFLEVEEVNGVCFSHYFTSGVAGRPVTSPNALITKKHVSCVMGHVQQDGIASQYTGQGKRITGIFAGGCYLHEEDYLGPQGNVHWRGVWMLHDVENGEFEPMQVSLKYLEERYGR
ncbi:MAG TPA: hypothetical protein VFM18_21955 [Methanosarcina sp.]|nr:hypothetical protein [Methanosarcina sp.]